MIENVTSLAYICSKETILHHFVLNNLLQSCITVKRSNLTGYIRQQIKDMLADYITVYFHSLSQNATVKELLKSVSQQFC